MILKDPFASITNKKAALVSDPTGGAWWKGGVVFLHAVRDGPASQSYGLQVAQLAGVPAPVIRAARRHLADLEEQAARVTRPQLDLFNARAQPTVTPEPEPQVHAALTRLAQIKPDELTPRGALDLLYELKRLAEEGPP